MTTKKGPDPNAPMTQKEEMKRMNLNVPSKMHRAFKIATISEGREMTEVLIEFIEKYIAEHSPAARPLAGKGGRK